MLGAFPPSVMIPCTRTVSGRCWRSAATPWKRRRTASSALIPCSGYAAACDAFPRKVNRILHRARHPLATWRREEAWTIIAASTPEKIPSSTIRALPYPVSSAGVPRAMTFPARKREAPKRASAAAAHAEATPPRLCPQACPRPGRASISHRNATAGFPLPKDTSARNAVSIPAIPLSTRNPRPLRNAARVSEVRFSWSGSSANLVIARSILSASGRSASANERSCVLSRSIFLSWGGGRCYLSIFPGRLFRPQTRREEGQGGEDDTLEILHRGDATGGGGCPLPFLHGARCAGDGLRRAALRPGGGPGGPPSAPGGGDPAHRVFPLGSRSALRETGIPRLPSRAGGVVRCRGGILRLGGGDHGFRLGGKVEGELQAETARKADHREAFVGAVCALPRRGRPHHRPRPGIRHRDARDDEDVPPVFGRCLRRRPAAPPGAGLRDRDGDPRDCRGPPGGVVRSGDRRRPEGGGGCGGKCPDQRRGGPVLCRHDAAFVHGGKVRSRPGERPRGDPHRSQAGNHRPDGAGRLAGSFRDPGGKERLGGKRVRDRRVPARGEKRGWPVGRPSSPAGRDRAVGCPRFLSTAGTSRETRSFYPERRRGICSGRFAWALATRSSPSTKRESGTGCGSSRRLRGRCAPRCSKRGRRSPLRRSPSRFSSGCPRPTRWTSSSRRLPNSDAPGWRRSGRHGRSTGSTRRTRKGDVRAGNGWRSPPPSSAVPPGYRKFPAFSPIPKRSPWPPRRKHASCSTKGRGGSG